MLGAAGAAATAGAVAAASAVGASCSAHPKCADLQRGHPETQLLMHDAALRLSGNCCPNDDAVRNLCWQSASSLQVSVDLRWCSGAVTTLILLGPQNHQSKRLKLKAISLDALLALVRMR